MLLWETVDNQVPMKFPARKILVFVMWKANFYAQYLAGCVVFGISLEVRCNLIITIQVK